MPRLDESLSLRAFRDPNVAPDLSKIRISASGQVQPANWTDSLPTLDAAGIEAGTLDAPTFDGLPADEWAEEEYGAVAAELAAAARCQVKASDYINATEAKAAAAALDRLPGKAEAIHMLIGVGFSMGHIIPAALRLAAPATIDELRICTLTFSAQNAADLAAMLDAGQVRALTLLCSVYFAKTSARIFEPAAEQLRPRGARVVTARCHAKIILARFSDGRSLAAEGSANLRSCRTWEQLTLFGDPQVYEFHRGWMDQLIERAGKKGHR